MKVRKVGVDSIHVDVPTDRNFSLLRIFY